MTAKCWILAENARILPAAEWEKNVVSELWLIMQWFICGWPIIIAIQIQNIDNKKDI